MLGPSASQEKRRASKDVLRLRRRTHRYKCKEEFSGQLTCLECQKILEKILWCLPLLQICDDICPVRFTKKKKRNVEIGSSQTSGKPVEKK